MAITGDCASPWTHWSSFADRPQKTHGTAAFLFGYKRLRVAHDEWHPCASQPLSWLKRVYSMTGEQQLTGPLLPICRRNIQMSKSMRIRVPTADRFSGRTALHPGSSCPAVGRLGPHCSTPLCKHPGRLEVRN